MRLPAFRFFVFFNWAYSLTVEGGSQWLSRLIKCMAPEFACREQGEPRTVNNFSHYSRFPVRVSNQCLRIRSRVATNLNAKKLNNVAWVGDRTIPSDCHLSAKLVPTFCGYWVHVISATGPYGRILDFLDRSRYFFFQVAPQLYSRDWVDPVPNPLLLRKSGSAGNRTRTSGSAAIGY
jgi:hypothetical protein